MIIHFLNHQLLPWKVITLPARRRWGERTTMEMGIQSGVLDVISNSQRLAHGLSVSGSLHSCRTHHTALQQKAHPAPAWTTPRCRQTMLYKFTAVYCPVLLPFQASTCPMFTLLPARALPAA